MSASEMTEADAVISLAAEKCEQGRQTSDVHHSLVISAGDYVNFYIANGINILPIKAGAKNPNWAWKQYQYNKYGKLEDLKAHTGNFFVLCGEISENLKILDIETWDVYEKYFSDIDSFTVKTPNGGVHIYYKHSDGLNRIPSVNGWPVEVRGEGHGCTSAGSTFEGKQYKVIKNAPIIEQDLSKLAHERLVKLDDDRDSDIQKWKKKIGISKVIAQTIEVKSRNKGCWMGICPFHDDKNASLAVYADNYYCFGCCEHGDVITWIEKRDNIGFKEAIEKISKEFGIEAPKLGGKPNKERSRWNSQVKISNKDFDVKFIDGTILVNRFDISEFAQFAIKTRITKDMRKRISEVKKGLNVDDQEWAELLSEVKAQIPKHTQTVLQLNTERCKPLEDCPFIGIFLGEIYPKTDVIATYLIEKFDLMAISEEKQVEGMALWIRTGNDYRQLPKSDLFLIKEMQTVMEEYGSSDCVKPRWIDRLEILRQVKTKQIVQPARGMFPVANGILDIKNKKLLTNDDGKICLVRSEVIFDPNAECPEFIKLLDDYFNGDKVKIEAFLSWLGAIIAGVQPQIIIMFKSRGRSGKGVLTEIISALLGNMLTMMSPNKLHERFSNWGFLHRRLVYLEEHDGKDATIKAMKELSGGCPCVDFETKGVQAIMHAPVQCAIIINTNNPPPFEKGSAWEERFKMLDFPNSYVENPKEKWEKKIDYSIKDSVMQELPGILNLILPYAQYALDNPNKMFKQDIPYKDIEKALDRSTESLENFINDCCELAPIEQDTYGNMKTKYGGYSVTDTTFMKRYEQYCSHPDVNVKASVGKYVKKVLKQDHRVVVMGHDLIGIRLKEKQESSNKSNGNLEDYSGEVEGT